MRVLSVHSFQLFAIYINLDSCEVEELLSPDFIPMRYCNCSKIWVDEQWPKSFGKAKVHLSGNIFLKHILPSI